MCKGKTNTCYFFYFLFYAHFPYVFSVLSVLFETMDWEYLSQLDFEWKRICYLVISVKTIIIFLFLEVIILFLEVIILFLEVIILFLEVIQWVVSIQLLWQLKPRISESETSTGWEFLSLFWAYSELLSFF